MHDIDAVAKCAGNNRVTTLTEVIDGLQDGTARYYGLLSDHSAILRIPTLEHLDAHSWAGYWVGSETVSIRRA